MLFGRVNLLGGDKKRVKCKENYIKRISKGKVEVFYLDLVEHCIKETKVNIDKGPRTWLYNKSTWIHRVNKFYRLVAYYEALLELEINYRTTNK